LPATTWALSARGTACSRAIPSHADNRSRPAPLPTCAGARHTPVGAVCTRFTDGGDASRSLTALWSGGTVVADEMSRLPSYDEHGAAPSALVPVADVPICGQRLGHISLPSCCPGCGIVLVPTRLSR